MVHFVYAKTDHSAETVQYQCTIQQRGTPMTMMLCSKL